MLHFTVHYPFAPVLRREPSTDRKYHQIVFPMTDTTTLSSPSISLDQATIVAFARMFDPQPYHLDEAAADASIFGGLCASGWQVAALSSRLTGEALASSNIVYVTTTHVSSMRWLRPTFVNDQLMAKVTTGERSAGSPVPGCDTLSVTVAIQDGNAQPVAEMRCLVAVDQEAGE